jgi:predicted dehydrogenase
MQVVAVADPDEKGREQAKQRSKALRQYGDYREMLKKEMPQLVSIAPRWTDQHLAMAKAAMAIGAHIYSEKPFAQTLADADELLEISKEQGLKIAVAHQIRLSAAVVQLKEEIARGLIGELVQIRSWGNRTGVPAGRHAGAGTHVFDLMRSFAGDPISCRADVWEKGEPINKQHAREATEKIGLIAGDEIEAQFTFPKNVSATFTSRARLRDTLGAWATELVGTKGIARILMDVNPKIYVSKSEQLSESGSNQAWQRFDKPVETGFAGANRRVVEDWLKAIEEKRGLVRSGLQWNEGAGNGNGRL